HSSRSSAREPRPRAKPNTTPRAEHERPTNSVKTATRVRANAVDTWSYCPRKRRNRSRRRRRKNRNTRTSASGSPGSRRRASHEPGESDAVVFSVRSERDRIDLNRDGPRDQARKLDLALGAGADGLDANARDVVGRRGDGIVVVPRFEV